MAASVDPTAEMHVMPDGVAILPPAPEGMLGRRTTALPPYLIAAVGCHGGAGTSTLAALLDHVADSGSLWPTHTGQPPFVVLVARDSIAGLDAASRAARQFHTGNAPDHIQLLGLVLVAARRGKPGEATRRKRDTVVAGMFERVWSIGWHDHLLDLELAQLPSAGPDTTPTGTGRRGFHPTRDVPADICTLGRDLRDAALTAHRATHP